MTNARRDALDQAAELVAQDMVCFRRELDLALEPQRAYLSDVEYGLYGAGKKIRPILLLLSARLVWAGSSAERLPQKIVRAAVSTEMLHTATLIHDDIIDGAVLRRGVHSVHAARGTEMAILIGDMQFVQAIRCFTDSIDNARDMRLVKLVLNTAFRICCGEIDELQTDPRRHSKSLRARYLRTIDRKTGILFGLACECGVALAGGRSRMALRLGYYGRRVGRAFQMMDDVLDLVSGAHISGKAQGIDLAHRRLSLPIIYAMEELGREHLVTQIMHGAKFNPAELAQAVKDIRSTKAILRVWQEARRQTQEAITYLQDFPQNAYRDALYALANFIVDRESSV